jgi:hypothetical protein
MSSRSRLRGWRDGHSPVGSSRHAGNVDALQIAVNSFNNRIRPLSARAAWTSSRGSACAGPSPRMEQSRSEWGLLAPLGQPHKIYDGEPRALRLRPLKLQRRRKQRGHKQGLDCVVAKAPRNDIESFPLASPRHEAMDQVQIHEIAAPDEMQRQLSCSPPGPRSEAASQIQRRKQAQKNCIRCIVPTEF